jgi:hypothetical protein
MLPHSRQRSSAPVHWMELSREVAGRNPRRWEGSLHHAAGGTGPRACGLEDCALPVDAGSAVGVVESVSLRTASITGVARRSPARRLAFIEGGFKDLVQGEGDACAYDQIPQRSTYSWVAAMRRAKRLQHRHLVRPWKQGPALPLGNREGVYSQELRELGLCESQGDASRSDLFRGHERPRRRGVVPSTRRLMPAPISSARPVNDSVKKCIKAEAKLWLGLRSRWASRRPSCISWT